MGTNGVHGQSFDSSTGSHDHPSDQGRTAAPPNGCYELP